MTIVKKRSVRKQLALVGLIATLFAGLATVAPTQLFPGVPALTVLSDGDGIKTGAGG